MSGTKLADSKALLNNLLHGAALPEHLSKPRSEGVDRKVIATKVAEQLVRAPLVAICFSHTCRCSAAWQSFGFYARKTAVDVPGQGRTFVTKRLEYIPHDEAPVETITQPVEEQVCINCFTNVGSVIRKDVQ
jgi:hypothetical protein